MKGIRGSFTPPLNKVPPPPRAPKDVAMCPLCEAGHPVDDQGYHVPTQAKGMIPYNLPCLKVTPPPGTVGAHVGHSRSVYYGHGREYNAHCWTGVEITSDSLRNIKRAAKALGWTCADITREDLLPEWVSRCGRYASESYLWVPRRKSNKEGKA